jgi:hypothetical protein
MTTKSFLSRPTSLIAIAALLGGSVSTLSAGDEPPVLGSTLAPLASGIEADFHVGYSSDYIFRGANQGGDLYEFGLDFAGSGDLVGLGAVDLSAGIWYGSAGAADELDVYGEVSKSLNEMLAVAVGITNYSYFGDGDNDIEPYISIGTTVGEISLGAAAHYDESDSQDHELYYEFTAGYERDLGENLSGAVELVLGWFDDTATDDADDDVFYGGTVSLSYAASGNITVTPHASVTFSENLGDYFFGGVSVGFGF